MDYRKDVPADVVRGGAGGAFIAIGALSAIEFTAEGEGYAIVIAFVIAGALIGIVLDAVKSGGIAPLVVSAVLFAIGRAFGVEFAEYMASGAVMYMGYVLALPEEDIFTNAVTGAAAAAGFLAAVVVLL